MHQYAVLQACNSLVCKIGLFSTLTGYMAVVQTWQRMKRRNKKLNSWENKHVLKCELDDAAVRKAKQKRRAPPVPSVNQLAWSQDDMLVCATCLSCCIWLCSRV